LQVIRQLFCQEALNGNKVQINNKSFDIFYENNVDEISFSSIAFENGTTNAVEKVDNTEYNLTLSDATTYLQLYYDDAEANDIVITKKTKNSPPKIRGAELIS